MRHEIVKNMRAIKSIKKNIKKDSDESSYGLENFDEDIEKLEGEAER